MSEDSKADLRLMERIARDDKEAFALLVGKYEQPLYRYAYRWTKRRSDAEDRVQDCFLRVWRSRKSFKGDCSPKTWLFKILHNLMINEYKKRGNQMVREAESLDTPHEDGERSLHEILEGAIIDPEKAYQSAQIREFVASSIERLDENARVMIHLRFIEGMAYEEIASVLEIDVGTVKSRINRSRAKFAKEFVGNGGGDYVGK